MSKALLGTGSGAADRPGRPRPAVGRSARTTTRAAVGIVAAAALTGCSSAADRPAGTPADGAGSGTEVAGPSGELTVFAAASLHGPFEEIAMLLEQQHPQLSISFSFAGSSDLVSQVLAGAPADVLATADERTMDDAVAGGVVAGEPTVFAANSLSLVVPAGNPAGIAGMDDLTGTNLVVCAPQVPCGAATSRLVAALGVTIAPVSEESSVTDVLGKVTSGQADAGIVYTTDTAAAGDTVDVVAVPGNDEVVNRYPVATVAGANDPELAELWVTTLTSETGRQVLADAGFGLP